MGHYRSRAATMGASLRTLLLPVVQFLILSRCKILRVVGGAFIAKREGCLFEPSNEFVCRFFFSLLNVFDNFIHVDDIL